MLLVRSTIAALSFAALALAQAPCWETNFGTNLALGDDAYSPSQALGFSFAYGGNTYTDIVVCSNGYIWLGTNAPVGIGPDYLPTEANLRSQGPRIAPLWNDFNPNEPGSGNIWYNTFPASGSTPARAVITWDHVMEYGHSTPLSMQCQMFDTGGIVLHYDSNMSVVAGGFGSNNPIVGASNGSNALNPVNFSVLPISTSGNPTLYQTIPRGPFPLTGRDMEWFPDGIGGFLVLPRTQCGAGSFIGYGIGCPSSLTTYEIFPPTSSFDLSNHSILFAQNGSGGYTAMTGPGLDPGYSTVLTIGDDQVIAGQPLGFSFPFAGANRTSVGLGSNGLIWMSASTTAINTGYPTALQMVGAADPVIAAMWQDLDPSPAGGGTVYWDTNASRAMMTWVNVPYWNVPGSSNTLQIKLLTSGDFVLSWGVCSNQAGGNALVGICAGNNAPDSGPIDWTTALPLSINSAAILPLALSAAAGSRPAINTTFVMTTSHIPAGTAIGAMILSFTQFNPGVSLGPIGMTGCQQFVGLDAKFLRVVAGSTDNFNLPVPNNTTLLGVRVFAQAAMFSAGFNPLGVIASNGGELRIGL